MTATGLVATEDAVHLQRIIVHCIPVELCAGTVDVIKVHAKVLRSNLWFFATM